MSMDNFTSEFLDNYLQFGLGSMPKADIDALVMHLLDKYGGTDNLPVENLSNQLASQKLKTPVSKIKKLRYEAALKYSNGRIEDLAMNRLLRALANATLELDGKENKICFLIEDNLAKNWLQGQLKIHQMIFDHSFNSEIVKVNPDSLFKVLESCFQKQLKEMKQFRKDYSELVLKKQGEALKKAFITLVKEFSKGAASTLGGVAVTGVL